jgi:hypothetical protein
MAPAIEQSRPTHDSDALTTRMPGGNSIEGTHSRSAPSLRKTTLPLEEHAPNCGAWACIKMRGLEACCADIEWSSKVTALAGSLCAGLKLVEDSQGTLVSGGCRSGWHSIKRLTEMFVSFRRAPLFQQ